MWTIEFLQDFGDLPLLVTGVSKLTHSSSGITATVAVEEIVKGTKESLDCSGRGLCDTDNRLCTCEPEFETSNGYNEEVICSEIVKNTRNVLWRSFWREFLPLRVPYFFRDLA